MESLLQSTECDKCVKKERPGKPNLGKNQGGCETSKNQGGTPCDVSQENQGGSLCEVCPKTRAGAYAKTALNLLSSHTPSRDGRGWRLANGNDDEERERSAYLW